eukprot:5189976-Alexandrium_andersonii.AAC.1
MRAARASGPSGCCWSALVGAAARAARASPAGPTTPRPTGVSASTGSAQRVARASWPARGPGKLFAAIGGAASRSTGCARRCAAAS